MGRLIDEIEIYKRLRPKVDNGTLDDIMLDIPTVEAIPTAVIKKFLEEGTKDVSNNVLAIVREEYIHKSEYENRLKADMVAMLTDIQLEIEELDSRAGYDGNGMPTFSTDYIRKNKVNELIQQKIDALKVVKDGTNY